MARRCSSFVLVFMAIVASACGAHHAPQVTPDMHDGGLSCSQLDPRDPLDLRDMQTMSCPQLAPPESAVLSCWDSALQMNQYGAPFGEWFDNELSNLPTLFKIEDIISGRVVCRGLVQPGGKQFGPVVWAHKGDIGPNGTKVDWEVTGTSYVTGVTPDRTKGRVGTRDSCLEYVRNYGWYSRYPCPNPNPTTK